MPIPPGTIVVARRYIQVVGGNPPPDYWNHSNLYGFVSLSASGAPNSQGNPTFYDILDGNTQDPGTPPPVYICYLLNDGNYWIEKDNMGPSGLAHTWSGWPQPGAPVAVQITPVSN